MRNAKAAITAGLAGAALFLLGTGRAAGQGGPGAVTVTPRMPVRGGSIVVKVHDYAAARQQVLDAARREGAELLDGRTMVNEKGKKHGWMRLRLSSDRLPHLLTAVHATGKLYAENVTTSDHASEYEELERRVGRLREHEARLATLLQNGRRLRGSDILFIQERLFRAGVDEGMLLQRRVDLERAARVSTLIVDLFEPDSRPLPGQAKIHIGKRFLGAIAGARLAMNRLLARGATALAFVLIFAPVWAPALLAGLYLSLFAARRLRRGLDLARTWLADWQEERRTRLISPGPISAPPAEAGG